MRSKPNARIRVEDFKRAGCKNRSNDGLRGRQGRAFGSRLLQ
jgi:hypothetical protein